MLDPRGRIDHPVVGCVLFGLGAWALLREQDVATGVRLLALAERNAYSRYAPSLHWSLVHAEAESLEPGALDAALAALGGATRPRRPRGRRAAVDLLR